jgi:hypothetical protein
MRIREFLLTVISHDVTLMRVPITDERAPEPKDFAQLLDEIMKFPADANFIFNCQMGRGRTTTGMVLWQSQYFAVPPQWRVPYTCACMCMSPPPHAGTSTLH